MKTKVTVSMEQDIYRWLKACVDDKRFAHVSHGVEYCVHKVKEGDLRD
ncbi:conserved hypothetical protein [Nitrosopumilaceae archaeon]|nr:hypothetical protein [Nitrosopumilus sp.]MDA8001204.1 hypothetical protein [Alphaproteobacteria bacterium]CAI9832148.1 conserved hypothetical protein [Nitrosopumilaceae archaeon]MDA7945349.1 hypothetical protein [Nitrosopumilus sp.]MDA7954928.1 hypothetical protein [Nitrosopumilus sp.]